MTRLPVLVFAAQAGSTLAVFGVIWFVQLVHYPLFLRADPRTFAAFETEHANRTGWVAAPLMILELLSSLLLVVPRFRVAGVTPATAWLGALLTVLTWLSTFLLQVPLHTRLHKGFDRQTIQRLVAGNWLRTGLWTVRMALVLYWIVGLIPG